MLWQTSLQTVSRTTEAPGEYPEEGPAPEAFADHGGSKLPMGIPDSSHSSHSWYLHFLLVGALDHELYFSIYWE